MGKMKDLYIGYMRTRRSLYIERAYAYSENQAFNIFCIRIAKKQGIREGIVFDWFADKTKYKIEKEVEFHEIADID